MGLSVFAVTGASKAMEFGLGPVQSVILGVIAAVGGGTIRDVLVGRVPSVMREGLYAILALAAAVITVTAIAIGLYGLPAVLIAAAVCFLIRLIGVRYNLNAPRPPGTQSATDAAGRE